MNVRESLRAKAAPAPAVVDAAALALRADGPAELAPEDRSRMIAEAAYYRAERRGFEPGHELEDWLAAEVEIDRELEAAEIATAAT
jgi:hypothetical protein